jgi:hypothetical protein
MAWYRIYRIDDEGHVRGPAVPIESETDQQAIELAQLFVDGVAMVWDGPRLIGRLDAPDPEGASRRLL